MLGFMLTSTHEREMDELEETLEDTISENRQLRQTLRSILNTTDTKAPNATVQRVRQIAETALKTTRG